MRTVKANLGGIVLTVLGPSMRRRGPAKGERLGRGKPINRRPYLFALVLPVLLFAGTASAQHPMLDRVANDVIQKYQQSSCEQLWQERRQPPSQRKQEAIQFLRNNPQMRATFIDRVAAPIANKMFECGMIP
jgi:hypothetical protein